MPRFFRLTATLVCLLAAVASGRAQSSANYTFTTGATASLAATTGGSAVAFMAEQSLIANSASTTNSGTQAIGFDFWFMGARYTQFNLGNDGQIGLGTATLSASAGNDLTLTSSASQAPVLAVFWDNLNTASAGSTVRTKVVGTAPNRVCVVEWRSLIGTASTTVPYDGRFQARLHESTGVIEYVYGEMAIGTNSAVITASIGFTAGLTDNNFVAIDNLTAHTVTRVASLEPATQSLVNASTAGPITALNSAADGSRRFYRFTPPIPATPTALTFPTVTATSITLAWTDNTSDQLLFAVYRSLDNVTYTLQQQLAANTTSLTVSGLAAGTTYHWRVVAISEGGLSTALTGSQATLPGSRSGLRTVGPTGADYPTLTSAFADLSAAGLAGPLVLELQPDYVSTGETFPLAATQLTTTATRPLTVRPAAGALGLALTSDHATGTLSLDGASHVTIDGRAGGVGDPQLTISNTSTTGYALRFVNDSTFNTVRAVTLQGAATAANTGVVLFGSTTGTAGNSHNTLENCTLRESTGTPAILIYSTGLAGAPNQGNTVTGCRLSNFFAPANNSAGIWMTGNNTNWTFSSNSFYQTAARVLTSGGTHQAISIVAAAGSVYTITDNDIGGSAPARGGSPWTVSGLLGRFAGIAVTGNPTSEMNVQGNRIGNISWTTTASSNAPPGIWSGIYVSAGSAQIGTVTGNTIGGTTGTDSIQVTASATGSVVYGIALGTSITQATVANNSVGALTLVGSATTVGMGFIGIQANANAATVVENNLIGSLTTPNSILANDGSTASTLQPMVGIGGTAVGRGTLLLSGNTVASLTNRYAGTAANGGLRGISVSGGSFLHNTVRDLTSSSLTTGSGSSAMLSGIVTSNGTSANPNVIEGNRVYALAGTSTTGAVNVVGIAHLASATGTHLVTGNLVHSLSLASTDTGASLTGILASAGSAVFSNNLVRLGLDADGNTLTTGHVLSGLDKSSSAANEFYHNTVYLGGSGVDSDSSSASAAFRRTVAAADRIANNIFVNARSSAGAGTARHYALLLTSAATVTAETNLYHAPGTGGRPASVDAGVSELLTIEALQNALGGQEGGSFIADPALRAPAAPAATLDLHLGTTTPAEGAGTALAAVTFDYDGDARDSLTPADIGADAGVFIAQDVAAPRVVFSPLGNVPVTASQVISGITITDSTGVNTTTAKPRLYYRQATAANTYAGNTSADDGWKWVEATGATSPFSFSLDYTRLFGGTPAAGTNIEYFVVAQDTGSPARVSINTGVFAAPPASVDLTAAAFPVGGTLRSFQLLAGLSGAKTVGAGGDFASLTGAGGLFATLNTVALTGDLVINIVSDLVEDGTHSLTGPADAGGAYTLTIQPGTAGEKLISGTAATGAPLIHLSGARRVIIDGRVNGTGTGKYLRFRHTNATPAFTGPTVQFSNGATASILRHCVIEGNASGATVGVVTFGAGSNTALVLSNNELRDPTGGTLGSPSNGVLSTSSENSVTVSDNAIYNFLTNGVLFSAVDDGCLVSGNNLYQTATSTATLQRGISIQGGSGHTIANNVIGGTAAAAGGTPWTNSVGVTFRGITLGVGTVEATSVQGNIIRNILLSSTSTGSYCGIEVTAGQVDIGTTTGNTIGHPTSADSIVAALSGTILHIHVTAGSTAPITIANNLVANCSSTGSPTTIGHRGISFLGSGQPTIRDNTVTGLSAATNTNSETTSAVLGILTSSTNADQVIAGNVISNLLSTGGTGGNTSTQVQGIIVTNNAGGGLISRNRVFDLRNLSTNNGGIFGIHPESGSWTVVNNHVMITNGTNTNAVTLIGLYEDSAAADTATYAQNTVYIGGSAAAGALKSYAFLRTVDSAVTLRNNLFYTARTGGAGQHVALGNRAPSSGYAWSSDYNALFAATPATLAEWGFGGFVTFAQLRTNSGHEANSGSNTTSAVTAAALFTAAAAGDLHIHSAATGTTVALISNTGLPLADYETDVDDDLRSNLTPDIGGDEFGPIVPTITRVTTSATGSYAVGGTLTFLVHYRSPVTVTGTPRLALTVGGQTVYATYTSAGSTSQALVFTYIVQAGDNDGDGVVLASPLQLDSGTIRGATGALHATLAFTPPTGLGSVVIDGVAPTLLASTPADNATDVAVNTTLVLTFSEPVVRGTGTLLFDAAGSSLDRSIDVTDPTAVSIDGATVTVTLPGALADSTPYDVLIPSTAFRDTVGTAFAGKVAGQLDFTTAAPVTLPEIAVSGGGFAIASGDTTPGLTDHTDFGTTATGSGQVERAYTIANPGTAPLTLASLTLSNTTDFSVVGTAPTSVAAGGAVRLVLRFNPASAGAKLCTVTLASNASDEAVFTFVLAGSGEVAVAPSALLTFETGNGTLGQLESAAVSYTHAATGAVFTFATTSDKGYRASVAGVALGHLGAEALYVGRDAKETALTVTVDGGRQFDLRALYLSNQNDEAATFTITTDKGGSHALSVPGGAPISTTLVTLPATAEFQGIIRFTVTPAGSGAFMEIDNIQIDRLGVPPDTAAPSITSGATAAATYRTPGFTFTVTADEAATFTATGLPPGLTLDSATGVISGTPTAAGVYPVSLNATDAATNLGTGALTITVATADLVVTGVVVAPKRYDGATLASFSDTGTLAGVISGDTVTLDLTNAAAAFDTARVGTGKTVTLSGFALAAGGASANYTLTPPPAVTSDITPQELTVTANSVSVTVHAPLPALTYTITGFVAGESAGSALTGAPTLGTAATPASLPGPFTITIDPGTLSAVPANYTFTFVPGTLTVLAYTYETWKQQVFSTADQNDATRSGPEADPDADGVKNLLEYAFDLDPNVPSVAGLPASTLTDVAGSNHLALTFTRSKVASDLLYAVQSSDDLLAWESSSPVQVGTPVDHGDTETVTFRSATALEAVSRRFLRVQTTLAPLP